MKNPIVMLTTFVVALALSTCVLALPESDGISQKTFLDKPLVPYCKGYLGSCVSDSDCCSGTCAPDGCTCSDVRSPCHVRNDCCLDFTKEPAVELHCYKYRCDKQGKFGRYPDH